MRPLAAAAGANEVRLVLERLVGLDAVWFLETSLLILGVVVLVTCPIRMPQGRCERQRHSAHAQNEGKQQVDPSRHSSMKLIEVISAMPADMHLFFADQELENTQTLAGAGVFPQETVILKLDFERMSQVCHRDDIIICNDVARPICTSPTSPRWASRARISTWVCLALTRRTFCRKTPLSPNLKSRRPATMAWSSSKTDGVVFFCAASSFINVSLCVQVFIIILNNTSFGLLSSSRLLEGSLLINNVHYIISSILHLISNERPLSTRLKRSKRKLKPH
jgi:hypothetical protein